MKVSTKGRYGLRAMVDLAVHSRGEHVALYSIAERQGISMNYLEQVFSVLRKSGLVKSVKGAQGGYLLAKSTDSIKVGSILRVLEGPLSIIDEIDEKSGSSETCLQQCIRVNVWDKMNACLNSIVESMTLEDLVVNYQNKNGFESRMYYI